MTPEQLREETVLQTCKRDDCWLHEKCCAPKWCHCTPARKVANEIYLRHYADNQEQDLGLSDTDVIINAMIEFYNTKPTNGNEKEQSNKDH